jgi:dehydrogenase/reductase SDR family protein 4
MAEANPIFDLTGKVALITGSSRGIGRAIAEQMAVAGAKVVISSRKKDACESVVEDLIRKGHDAIAIPCNVANLDELQSLVAQTKKTFGQIDILVANAATNPTYGPSLDMTDEVWDKIMSTNVKSVFRLCNMVLPEMAVRKNGVIIVISSVAATMGSETLGAYAVSKAAEAQLTRNLAVEWGKHNIRVNAIAPGLIKTDFAKALWENPQLVKRVEAMTALKRTGETDDIAGLAVALATPACKFITGQFIVADGGMTISGSL